MHFLHIVSKMGLKIDTIFTKIHYFSLFFHCFFTVFHCFVSVYSTTALKTTELRGAVILNISVKIRGKIWVSKKWPCFFIDFLCIFCAFLRRAYSRPSEQFQNSAKNDKKHTKNRHKILRNMFFHVFSLFFRTEFVFFSIILVCVSKRAI